MRKSTMFSLLCISLRLDIALIDAKKEVSKQRGGSIQLGNKTYKLKKANGLALIPYW
jgi:hypothetical protein